MWWKGPAAPNLSAVAEAVFFDICELVQKIPNCAVGRAMNASLTSTPAASASGGQAASSSGPPPTSATPPSELGPMARQILDANGAGVPSRSILEVPSPQAKAASSGPQPLAGIKRESDAETESLGAYPGIVDEVPRVAPPAPPPEPPQREAGATVPLKAQPQAKKGSPWRALAVSEADSSVKASARRAAREADSSAKAFAR